MGEKTCFDFGYHRRVAVLPAIMDVFGEHFLSRRHPEITSSGNN